jgi:hypothetical protein
MIDDAARVWTLLALRSGMDRDRLEARRRLEVIGNREDLQRIGVRLDSDLPIGLALSRRPARAFSAEMLDHPFRLGAKGRDRCWQCAPLRA